MSSDLVRAVLLTSAAAAFAPVSALGEYRVRLAEKLGFSRKEDGVSRRAFLRGALAVGALVLLPDGQLILPESKVHQVPGKHVARWRVSIPYLVPIEGQVGLFQMTPTGEIVNIRDFIESDSYDSVVCLPSHVSEGIEFTFFSDVQGKRASSDDLKKSMDNLTGIMQTVSTLRQQTEPSADNLWGGILGGALSNQKLVGSVARLIQENA